MDFQSSKLKVSTLPEASGSADSSKQFPTIARNCAWQNLDALYLALQVASSADTSRKANQKGAGTS
eukprot:5565659-Amphidinium_carterae.1